MKINKISRPLATITYLAKNVLGERFVTLLLFSIVFSLPTSYAQVKIGGVVKTIREEIVPFANVLLLKAGDSSFIKGTVADESGYWAQEIPPGKLLVKITMVGYEPAYSQVLDIEDNGKEYFLDDLRLAEAIVELEEITIREQKFLIEKKADRMIVNISNSPTAAGSSVLEVLEKSPGVVGNTGGSTSGCRQFWH